MRNWTLAEWVMAAVLAAIVAVVAASIVHDVTDPCVRSHVEHGRLLYFQHAGKVSFPIYGDQTVCDERESERRGATP